MARGQHRWLACTLLIFLLLIPPLQAAPPLPGNGQQAPHGSAGVAKEATPAPTHPLPLALRAKIDPLALKEAEERGTATFVVHLREQADLQGAEQALDKAERRWRVYEALRQTASRTQASIIAELEREKAAGRVLAYRPFFIFNGLAVTAGTDVLLALAQRPDVESIRANRRHQLPAPRRAQVEAPALGWNLERIRAVLAEQAFGVDGSGVVVANIDTGVDWTHPALQSRYRGYNPADPTASVHDYNWFDATRTYPTAPGPNAGHLSQHSDHGTHAMGTIVGMEPDGSNRVGVAPGARWVAARAFNNDGEADDVTLHACFEWMLAPTDLNGQNPDPSKAPDIVSNSWGNSDPSSTEFLDDVRAWRAAGIFPVFAAGNEGPGAQSINVPGGYPEVLAVGATDVRDQIADFSGRGPSPWVTLKPEVSAPGVNIRSTIAGGGYEDGWSGTSMAAPHVAGLVALLYQASARRQGSHIWPPLTYTATFSILTSTAVDLGTPGPDTAYGWGRIDAYQATAAASKGGTFRGQVSDALTRQGIAGALITMVNRRTGGTVQMVTDAQGRYAFTVAAGSYDVTASHYYYRPFTAPAVDILAATTTRLDFDLQPLPTGTIQGRVSDLATGVAITATVSIPGTPAATVTDGAGYYRLQAPAGTVDLRIQPGALGHRAAQCSAVEVRAGQVTPLDVALPTAPRILLVDADYWRSSPELAIYQADLSALLYPFHTWHVARIPDDSPPAAVLNRYDLVIWTQADSSPGYIGAWDGLSAYLEQGGRLLISGQDIGYWDSARGYGSDPYTRLLHARFLLDDAGPRQVFGPDGSPLAGTAVDLNTIDSAGNQYAPSEIAPNDGYARPVLAYPGGGTAALAVEDCAHRALYLAFGLGGAGGEASRRQLLEKCISHLTSPRPAQDFDLFSAGAHATTSPGGQVTYRASVVNVGSSPAQYDLRVLGSAWPVTVLDASGSTVIDATSVLAPCARQDVSVRVHVPLDTVAGMQSVARLRATPRGQPAGSQELQLVATILPEWVASSPLPSARYRLSAAGIGCQVYVAGGFDDSNRALSAVLRYNAATGAWARVADKPTPVGNLALVAHGGRLYAIGGYSSDGGLTDVVEVYDPATDRWTLETRLPQPVSGAAAAVIDGVLYVFGGATAGRDLAATWAYDLAARTWRQCAPMPGGPRSFAGAAVLAGSIYVAGGWPALRTVERYDPSTNTWSAVPPLALGRQSPGMASVGGRLYVAGGGNQWTGLSSVECFDPELGRWFEGPRLQIRDRAGAAAALAAGKLFVLGGTGEDESTRAVESLLIGTSLSSSALRADRAEVQPGQRLTYTLTLRNPGTSPIAPVRVYDALPPHTRYVAGSASGGLVYEAGPRRLSWQGPVGARAAVTLGFAVEVNEGTPNGTVITNTATITGDPCGEHAVSVGTRVLAADLRGSSLRVEPAMAVPGDVLTCTIELNNAGPYAAPGLTVSNTMPAGVDLVPGSLVGGAQYSAASRTLSWHGDLPPASGRQASYGDSDDAGVPFSWVDATGGTRVTLTDDGADGPFPLGFAIRFFENTYDKFYIGANGLVSFGGPSRDYSNACIPNEAPPNAFIAALWDDLNPAEHGTVHYQTFGQAPRRYTVIQWTEVPRYGDAASRLTFQIVIREENQEVWLQYLHLQGVGSAGESATVGIESGDGKMGLAYLCNGEPAVHALHNHLAIRLLLPQPQTPSRHTIGYRVRIDPSLRPSTIISNVATLTWRGQTWPLTATTAVAWVDLASSELALTPRETVSGDPLTCTLTLRNTGNYAAQPAAAEIPLPAWVEFVAGSATGGATYQAATRRVTWSGSLEPQGAHTLSFALGSSPQAPPGTPITLTATLRDGYGQSWPKTVASYLLGSALAGSRIEASSTVALPGETLTYTIYIHNIGPEARAVLTDTLPPALSLVADSLWASAGQVSYQGGVVGWSGTVPSGALLIVRYRARLDASLPAATLVTNTVRLDDGRIVVERQARVQIGQYDHRLFLPVLERHS